MHCPTTVIRPMPIPIAAMPFRFSIIFVIACAAIAIVPIVDTVDWIASFPNWNMAFSIPFGIPTARIILILYKSGLILK